jgi:hypothetical protein
MVTALVEEVDAAIGEAMPQYGEEGLAVGPLLHPLVAPGAALGRARVHLREVRVHGLGAQEEAAGCGERMRLGAQVVPQR